MKKFIALFLVATLLSCSSEDQIIVDSKASKFSSVLDGDLLSFKNDEFFIAEYSALAESTSREETQKWISSKGHASLLNLKKDQLLNQEEENFVDSEDLYSDALKAVFNSEYKVKINGSVIWLNKFKFYTLNSENIYKTNKELEAVKDDLEVYGNISQSSKKKSSNTSKEVPNANKSKEWTIGYRYDGRDRRTVITLFNETIYLNGIVQTSKMFIRGQRLGEYCSVWKCRWNSDENGRMFVKFTGNVVFPWTLNSSINNSNSVYGYELVDSANTVLLAQTTFDGAVFAFDSPTANSNFVTVNILTSNGSVITTQNQVLSWF